jgi:hypothetical protein
LRTICLGWLWTKILLTSDSWVSRITGVSHHITFWGRYCYFYFTGEETEAQRIYITQDFRLGYLLATRAEELCWGSGRKLKWKALKHPWV